MTPYGLTSTAKSPDWTTLPSRYRLPHVNTWTKRRLRRTMRRLERMVVRRQLTEAAGIYNRFFIMGRA